MKGVGAVRIYSVLRVKIYIRILRDGSRIRQKLPQRAEHGTVLHIMSVDKRIVISHILGTAGINKNAPRDILGPLIGVV